MIPAALPLTFFSAHRFSLWLLSALHIPVGFAGVKNRVPQSTSGYTLTPRACLLLPWRFPLLNDTWHSVFINAAALPESSEQRIHPSSPNRRFSNATLTGCNPINANSELPTFDNDTVEDLALQVTRASDLDFKVTTQAPERDSGERARHPTNGADWTDSPSVNWVMACPQCPPPPLHQSMRGHRASRTEGLQCEHFQCGVDSPAGGGEFFADEFFQQFRIRCGAGVDHHAGAGCDHSGGQ